jgi:hypothetical protein
MVIKPAAFAALVTLALAHPAQAASCVNGVYRAGCVGPNGAAVVRKGPVYHAPVYRHGGAVHCAHGVYRAGCVGPNGGAAVVRRPY